jgi:predicted DNA-binding transcriptional regulator AlpA
MPEAAKALAKRDRSPRREDISRPAQMTAGIGHNRGPPIAPPIARAASTVDEFCESHGISKPMVYKLWKQGIGPKFMSVGSRRLISSEAAAALREEVERRSEHEDLPDIERRQQRASATARARFAP